MFARMNQSVGRAGQPGYVVAAGDRVMVKPAHNLPQGGYFVENLYTGESILCDGSEFDYEF